MYIVSSLQRAGRQGTHTLKGKFSVSLLKLIKFIKRKETHCAAGIMRTYRKGKGKTKLRHITVCLFSTLNFLPSAFLGTGNNLILVSIVTGRIRVNLKLETKEAKAALIK